MEGGAGKNEEGKIITYTSNATDEMAQIPSKEMTMIAVSFFIMPSTLIIVRDFTNGYLILHDFQICKVV
jgi:hypothetical protein